MAEEPIAVVDLMNNDVRNHRIVIWICLFGNIEVLLNDSFCMGRSLAFKHHDFLFAQ